VAAKRSLYARFGPVMNADNPAGMMDQKLLVLVGAGWNAESTSDGSVALWLKQAYFQIV